MTRVHRLQSSLPERRHPMTWRRYDSDYSVTCGTSTGPIGGSIGALASDAPAPLRAYPPRALGPGRGVSHRVAPRACRPPAPGAPSGPHQTYHRPAGGASGPRCCNADFRSPKSINILGLLEKLTGTGRPPGDSATKE